MNLKFRLLFLVFMALLIPYPTAHAQNAAETSIEALLAATRVKVPLNFCGEKVPLDTGDVRERFDREMLLSLWREPQVILWIKRMSRYMPAIAAVFHKYGLPEDLKYLAVIESDLMPHEGSPKGAMGYWQFMEGTAEKYGLRVDDQFDDRRNLYKSTEAAAKYLLFLHQTFNSWTLSAAAYNMGEEGLKAAMLEQKTDDFYRLYLPLETQRYILRAITVKIILANPAAFGFHLLPSDLYPPIDYETVAFNLTEDTAVQLIAESAGTDFKVIKDLNPEIRGYYLPSGTNEIAVPKGAGKRFNAYLAELVEKSKISLGKRMYEVTKGDSLSSIAERFNVPLPALLIWNRLNLSGPIHPGDKIIISKEP
jgi:membrane-bound lytic murein transglycosylase D